MGCKFELLEGKRLTEGNEKDTVGTKRQDKCPRPMKKPLWLLYFVVLTAVGLFQLSGTDIWAGSTPDPGPW